MQVISEKDKVRGYWVEALVPYMSVKIGSSRESCQSFHSEMRGLPCFALSFHLSYYHVVRSRMAATVSFTSFYVSALIMLCAFWAPHQSREEARKVVVFVQPICCQHVESENFLTRNLREVWKNLGICTFKIDILYDIVYNYTMYSPKTKTMIYEIMLSKIIECVLWWQILII